jgi:general secretion pathway protein N
MRADSLSPKTWLLAGIAGWAVCLWVFALLGLGGRLGENDMPVAARQLPTTTIPRAERPGPQAQYAEIGVRPIFAEDRKPHPFVINGTGEEAQVNTFDYTLTSVLIASGVQLAILKPAADGAPSVRVKVGEAVETAPQWTLASLLPRSATFRGPEGDKSLELRVFNGVGGAAPPPIARDASPGNVVIDAPVPPPPGDQPGPQSAPQVPPPPVASGGDANNVSTQAQLDAIRKRIEARRAQLRQQAAQEAQNPAAQPGQTP